MSFPSPTSVKTSPTSPIFCAVDSMLTGRSSPRTVRPMPPMPAYVPSRSPVVPIRWGPFRRGRLTFTDPRYNSAWNTSSPAQSHTRLAVPRHLLDHVVQYASDVQRLPQNVVVLLPRSLAPDRLRLDHRHTRHPLHNRRLPPQQGSSYKSEEILADGSSGRAGEGVKEDSTTSRDGCFLGRIVGRMLRLGRRRAGMF